MSFTGAWAQSFAQPSTAILNLRGRVRFSGLKRKYSWIAMQYGATSKGSVGAVPAYGQAVTLRTLPAHAPRSQSTPEGRRRVLGALYSGRHRAHRIRVRPRPRLRSAPWIRAPRS